MSSFSKLSELIEKQRTYITSKELKEKIAEFYKNSWLPISEDFKNKFGELNYNFIENSLFDLYKNTKTNVMVKRRLLSILKPIEPILDSIQIELIRKYGAIIEYDKRKQIVDNLIKYGFKGTLGYLKDSEGKFGNGEWKNCCFSARLAIEEFMREFREKVTKKSVQKGTLSNHINPIKQKVGLKEGEIKLIEEGFYGFLSEKGGHATTDIPDREDSAIAIYIVYLTSDYLLNKYSSFF